MGVLCDNIRVSYISVPKCACSSLKMYFHEVASGSSWAETQKHQKGAKQTVHEVYPSIPASERDWGQLDPTAKVAVVRGPIDRLISCFQNKVENEQILHRRRIRFMLRLRRLPLSPTFEEFVTHLEGYRRVSPSIRRHTELLSHWLGEDPSVYARIYHIRDLDALQEWVEAKGGRANRIPWANRSEDRLTRKELPSDLRSKIRARYKKDYALYGDWLRRRHGKSLVLDDQTQI